MTSAVNDLVREHYEPGDTGEDLVSRVSRLLDDLGDGSLTAAQLAALDQFHTRGMAATADLARCVEPQAGLQVLDAGSGLGGPSRYLAETHGCEVTGIDLTPAFVELSRRIARRSSAAGRLHYVLGDVCALPMEDVCFDLVWTQHVLMNVHDRARAYAEFYRVLKPGGRLACYDVIAAEGKPALEFPVPWASVSAASHLLTKAETLAALDSAGFDLLRWDDVTDLALSWFSQTVPASPQALGLATVMGPRMQAMVGNLARGLRENRIGVANAVFARRASP